MLETLKKMLDSSFEGKFYYLADNWFDAIAVLDYAQKPIKYLEIGTFYGANLFSVGKSYGLHPESQLHCIDPWQDYEEYPEYKGEQPNIYETFLKNLETSGQKDKITIHRGYSHTEVPKFEENYFDIIYIDGNHEPEYVLEDAVLCFRKLKPGGYMIFDDYGWGGPDLTKRGIDSFLNGYHKRIIFKGCKNAQVFLQKK
jgi:SAM-dependent methyltransferase